MDAFRLRRRVVEDYGSYATSFIQIKNECTEEVLSSLGKDIIWPALLIQLNHSFEAGETIDEPVAQGILRSSSCDHPEKGGRGWPVLRALPVRIRRRGR